MCTNAKRDLERITTRKKDAAGRGCSGFNPLAHDDTELFQAVMDGEHCLRGFTYRDIRTKLQLTPHLRSCGQDWEKGSSEVTVEVKRLDVQPRGFDRRYWPYLVAVGFVGLGFDDCIGNCISVA